MLATTDAQYASLAIGLKYSELQHGAEASTAIASALSLWKQAINQKTACSS
jgi:hypothetical protein